MTIEDEYRLFIENPTKMEKYKNAINELRELGLERILRRLGEPIETNPADPRALEVLALLGSRSQGYFDAINTFFDITSIESNLEQQSVEPDFGSDDKLGELGYGRE